MVTIGPVTVPDYGLSYTGDNVQLKIGEKLLGLGTLSITQNALYWQPNDTPDGISFFWKQISVHGIATDPTKCIYFMVDQQLNWPGVYEPSTMNGLTNGVTTNDDTKPVSDDDDDEDIFQDAEEEQITECWLIPEDINTVDVMFNAMAECQALHPDSADSISSDSNYMDDEDDDGNDAKPILGSNVLETSETAAAQNGIRNLNLNDNPQFEDADE